MKTRMILFGLTIALVTTSSIQPAGAQQNPFLGRWNLTGTGENSALVYWLDVTQDAGQLAGMFLNRGGNPNPLASIKIENGELVFQGAPRRGGPGPIGHARAQGDKITGSIDNAGRVVEFVGVHSPKWPPADANAAHQFGTPVELFDGKSMDGWVLVRPDQPWSVTDGVMTNSPPGSNLISKQKFQDYRIHAEYKLAPGSHSGIYVRGRYEMQVVQDDSGKPPDKLGNMAIYGWVAPLVTANSPADEWQTMEATVVLNKVSATLNGRKVHDNTTLEAITGNAVDANELEPGPIMLVGNDGKLWYRKVTVTPIVDARR